MTPTVVPAIATPALRFRATPYARKLARQRNLPLTALTGSGPNGRIVGDDVANYEAPVVPSPVAAEARAAPTGIGQSAASPASTMVATPSAIAIGADFSAVDALLEEVAKVRPGVTREDVCLKAAATALASVSLDAQGSILLVTASGQRRLSGLAEASLGAVSAIRERAGDIGSARLAVSFIGRPGIRPLVARLIGSAEARLIVGAADKDCMADCLLSYDPNSIADDVAADYLAAFRELVHTPFRLLV